MKNKPEIQNLKEEMQYLYELGIGYHEVKYLLGIRKNF
jgi:hypothetical protein